METIKPGESHQSNNNRNFRFIVDLFLVSVTFWNVRIYSRGWRFVDLDYSHTNDRTIDRYETSLVIHSFLSFRSYFRTYLLISYFLFISFWNQNQKPHKRLKRRAVSRKINDQMDWRHEGSWWHVFVLGFSFLFSSFFSSLFAPCFVRSFLFLFFSFFFSSGYIKSLV